MPRLSSCQWQRITSRTAVSHGCSRGHRTSFWHCITTPQCQRLLVLPALAGPGAAEDSRGAGGQKWMLRRRSFLRPGPFLCTFKASSERTRRPRGGGGRAAPKSSRDRGRTRCRCRSRRLHRLARDPISPLGLSAGSLIIFAAPAYQG